MDSKDPKRHDRTRRPRRERRILKHARKNRIFTYASMLRGPFAGKTVDAVKSALRRLRADGLVVSRDLPFDNRSYYQLTEAGCRAAGAPREMARPLGSQGLIEKFALLWLCSIEPKQPRVLVNPGDYDNFDVDPQKLRRVHFYVQDSDRGPIFGFVKIDHGTTTRRLRQKTIARLVDYVEHGWLDDVIRAGAFEVTVLVPTEQQRQSLLDQLPNELQSALNDQLRRIFATSREQGIIVHVKVVPDLDRLILSLLGK